MGSHSSPAQVVEGAQPIQERQRARLLASDLKRHHPEDRIAAARLLEKLGAAARVAVPALIEAMKDDNIAVRQQVADAIFVIEPTVEYTSELIGLLEDSDERVRDRIGATFAKVERATDEVVAKLTDALKNENPLVRAWVAKAIHWIGPSGRQAGPGLCVALKDEDDNVRKKAAMALGEIGWSPTVVVPLLTDTLKDDNPSVRRSSAYALGRIGSHAKDAVPSLVELTNDDDEHVREKAIEALGYIGHPTDPALSALIEVLKDAPESFSTTLAIVALGKLGPPAKRALPQLRNLLHTAHGDAVEWAISEIDLDA